MSKVAGHFEITNQALNELKKTMPSSKALSGVPTVKGRLGRGEVSHFVHGSASLATGETESPAFGAVYRDIRDVWSRGHWENSAQKHHFMRRFTGQNSRSAYEEAVKWISSEAALSARLLGQNMNSGRSGNVFQGMPSDHLGNAVHALQDSFSASHVKREGVSAKQPGRIAKIYVYMGHEKDKHSDHDKLWKTDSGDFSETGRHAVDSTKHLIESVVRAATQNQSALHDWTQFQTKWLETSPRLDEHHEVKNNNLIDKYIHTYLSDHGSTTIIHKRQLVDAIYRDLSTDAINLKEVFETIDHAHWCESDDIAELYVQKVQSEGGSAQSTLRNNPDVVKVLVRCLDEGWTTAGEQKCIDWLESL